MRGIEKQMQILLVEDNMGHGTLIQMNLKDAGVTNLIDHVTDGQSALDYVKKYLQNTTNTGLLILLDLNLPGMDGYAVLEQLKGDPKSNQIPIIVLTSTDDPREIERCYALGCNVYVRKPVNYADFIEAIKRLGLFVSVISLPENKGKVNHG